MKFQINKFLFIIPLLESLPQKSLEGFNLLSTQDNKRHCISHLKCGPENLLHSHNKGQAGRGSNVPHFPSQVITYTKAIHPLPSP